ncbi:MAG: hypothetical protein AVDCRST_MAG40-524 [uncultured Gemmatimonadaceae bacterium]|uniref:ATP synthase protein I2 n=1 Tax=uncultured Gemmatimonadaceae bacterium TaxID=246130 RepID=A0A6J4KH32_9BACT|nr:MAG: hypothetical protein AVDCRST_MAG40-524 [uncultured Gemmatimonadaceae bacterium]
MRAVALYTVSAAIAIGVLAVLLALAFRTPADHRALLVSAGIAFVVQVAAFVVLRLSPPGSSMKAWGLGAVLRLVTLLVYALLALEPLGLPPTAALISLVTFFFVSTLLETRLLTA